MTAVEFYLVTTFSQQLAACVTRGVDPLCAESIAHEATDQVVSGMAPAWLEQRLAFPLVAERAYPLVLEDVQRIIDSLR